MVLLALIEAARALVEDVLVALIPLLGLVDPHLSSILLPRYFWSFFLKSDAPVAIVFFARFWEIGQIETG